MALSTAALATHYLQRGLRGPGTRDRMRAGTTIPRAQKVSDNHMELLR